MTSSALADWIEQRLAADPPRAKSLVMTVFGDAIAPHGGNAWLGSLIGLLAPFHVNDRLLRTSVYRLVQEGWLSGHRDGRRSQYTIEAAALPRFARANARIYTPAPASWDGQWTLVLGPFETLPARERSRLRQELGWLGFGSVGPGVLAHPSASHGALGELLARLDASGHVTVMSARDLPGVTARKAESWIENSWDLSGIKQGYEDFLNQFGRLDRLCQTPRLAEVDAYAARTLLIHAYRRVQLHDPMLPLALLPGAWPGPRAHELTGRIYRRLHVAADRFIVHALASEAGRVAPCDEAYFRRFGGLGSPGHALPVQEAALHT
jgi:phenylacetic acid degradation operon negative regulatory protein